MSFVAGCDISSYAVDVVLLSEDDNSATWHRFELAGANAWERTLRVRDAMPPAAFWDDVYLVAVETPFPDQQRTLRLVQGAVTACLPPALREAHRCWQVRPDEWKHGLGLKGKPDMYDVGRVAPNSKLDAVWDAPMTSLAPDWQNGRDAYCLALWAREENRKVAA